MKILHITYGFNGGGVGFVIANYCTRRKMQGIQFDIVGEDIGKNHLLHQRFAQAGFGVHYVTPKKKCLWKNIADMAYILKRGHYDAVHVHFEEWSFLYLMLAWLYRVPVRVCHAHMAYMEGAAEKPHYKLFRVLLNRFATLRLACSRDAGEHLYGSHPYVVLNNAIDVAQFRFAPDVRKKKRQELQLEECFVIGTVGRLSYQKNPEFTVEIMNELVKYRPNAMLLLVGQGELERHVRDKVHALGLGNRVHFLGQRSDVPELMQAMDAFVLPSRFEGLGIVYIEAQAAGLPTFATADVVPQEACISQELFSFLPRRATPKEWSAAVLEKAPPRKDISELLRSRGYDIEYEISKLESLYLKEYSVQ